MNKTMKTTLILNLIVLALSILLTIYSGISLITFINSLFTIALLLLVIGLFMFVSRGGFFDAITLTFRKVFASASKRAQLLQADMKDLSLPSDLFGSKITYIFLLSGLALTILTTLIGFLL